jgi:hypothetical protein
MAKETKKKDTLTQIEEMAKTPEFIEAATAVFDSPKKEDFEDEPPVNNKPIIEGKAEAPKPTYRKELDATFSFEQRIMAYLATRNTSDYVRINDFLKSLYGVPVFNEPQKWSLQTESKKLRVILENMRANGLFTVKDNAHMRLAAQYYEGEQQYTKHHTLNTISIEVKI